MSQKGLVLIFRASAVKYGIGSSCERRRRYDFVGLARGLAFAEVMFA